jgi:hypothetical protein
MGISTVTTCYFDGVSPSEECFGSTSKYGPYVVFVAGTIASHATSIITSLDIAKPTGTQEGDLLVTSAFSRNTFVGMPEGSGWDVEWSYGLSQSGNPSINPSNNDRSELWSKFAGASEPSDYTCAITDAGSGRGMVIICAAFRNAFGVGTFSQTGDPAAPSVPASAGDMLLGINGTSFDADAAVVPASMTEIHQTNTASACGGAAAYESITADGETGTRTWTAWDSFNLTGNVVIEKAPL